MIDVTRPLVVSSVWALNLGARLYSQASHHKSHCQADPQSCGGVQIPHGPYGDHENDDVGQDVWDTAISEKGFLVNAVGSRQLWVPICRERPT